MELIKQINKKVLAIVILAVLALAVPITLILLKQQQDIRQRASATAATVYFDPSDKNVITGGEFSVKVLLNANGNDIALASITVTFPPDKLEAVKYDKPLSGLTNEVIPGTINNPAGTLKFVITRQAVDTPITGSNVDLGTVTFRAKTTGTADVTIINPVITDRVTETEITVNVTPGHYSISDTITTDQDATPTQTQSPTATNTPAPTDGTVNCFQDANLPNACPCSSDSQCSSGYCNIPSGEASGTCQTRPTPTSTPIPTATTIPTATSTPIPTVTSAPTATPTTAPTATLAPTATVVPGDTALSINVSLPGIGNNVTPGGQNPSPIRPQRTAEIEILNAQNQTVKTSSGILTYSSTTAQYQGSLSLGSSFPTGSYTAKVRFDNTLKKALPGIVSITNGTSSNTTPVVTLVPGDINHDNELNISDWNLLLSCYGNKVCSSKTAADLNDDGKVEEKDLSILQRGFATRHGD